MSKENKKVVGNDSKPADDLKNQPDVSDFSYNTDTVSPVCQPALLLSYLTEARLIAKCITRVSRSVKSGRSSTEIVGSAKSATRPSITNLYINSKIGSLLWLT